MTLRDQLADEQAQRLRWQAIAEKVIDIYGEYNYYISNHGG